MLNQDLNNLTQSKGKVQRGQVIISKGEIVTDATYQMLDSFRSKFEGRTWNDDRVNWYLIGQFLLVLTALIIFILFLQQFRRPVFDDNKKLTFLLTLVVLMVAMATFSNIHNALIYVMPFCLLPIILKAFFDTRLALFTHIITITIIGFAVPNLSLIHI